MDHTALLVRPDLQEKKYSYKHILSLCEERTENIQYILT